jgi:uncharacterized membrane protein YphA (DoxX/SURF4 family)
LLRGPVGKSRVTVHLGIDNGPLFGPGRSLHEAGARPLLQLGASILLWARLTLTVTLLLRRRHFKRRPGNTGPWLAGLIVLACVAGFVGSTIPHLSDYLRKRYRAEYEEAPDVARFTVTAAAVGRRCRFRWLSFDALMNAPTSTRHGSPTMPRNSKKANVLLWTVQVLLALLFLFAGGMKLVLPLTALERGPIPLPGIFLRFIGIAELLGGVGLVLPGLFRTHLHLTPLAAAGLVGIMTGATVLTALGSGLSASLFPLVVGGLALAVCLGRGGVGIGFGRRPARGASVLQN